MVVCSLARTSRPMCCRPVGTPLARRGGAAVAAPGRPAGPGGHRVGRVLQRAGLPGPQPRRQPRALPRQHHRVPHARGLLHLPALPRGRRGAGRAPRRAAQPCVPAGGRRAAQLHRQPAAPAADDPARHQQAGEGGDRAEGADRGRGPGAAPRGALGERGAAPPAGPGPAARPPPAPGAAAAAETPGGSALPRAAAGGGAGAAARPAVGAPRRAAGAGRGQPGPRLGADGPLPGAGQGSGSAAGVEAEPGGAARGLRAGVRAAHLPPAPAHVRAHPHLPHRPGVGRGLPRVRRAPAQLGGLCGQRRAHHLGGAGLRHTPGADDLGVPAGAPALPALPLRLPEQDRGPHRRQDPRQGQRVPAVLARQGQAAVQLRGVPAQQEHRAAAVVLRAADPGPARHAAQPRGTAGAQAVLQHAGERGAHDVRLVAGPPQLLAERQPRGQLPAGRREEAAPVGGDGDCPPPPLREGPPPLPLRGQLGAAARGGRGGASAERRGRRVVGEAQLLAGPGAGRVRRPAAGGVGGGAAPPVGLLRRRPGPRAGRRPPVPAARGHPLQQQLHGHLRLVRDGQRPAGGGGLRRGIRAAGRPGAGERGQPHGRARQPRHQLQPGALAAGQRPGRRSLVMPVWGPARQA
ncbi:collagen, type I, alpha 1a-like isoform X3 [Bacillus rossius redtenbacheri]|uniref:collagen, type I, alpha 1a-like isoform X3 n=1 Tax=Bacillus rossius redtenbacheri TaxID=93214 RepID=UPI002FDDE219